VLEQHDLFEQFAGNPYSILTAAEFYKNPYVKFGNDLKSIYRRFESLEIYLDELNV
jgi:hypothetical protein